MSRVAFIIGVVIVSLWLPMRSVSCQTYDRLTQLDVDTLDPKPNWDYGSLYNATRAILARHPEIAESGYDRKLSAHLSIGYDNNVDSTILNWPLEVHVLAWVTEWVPCRYVEQDAIPINVPDDQLANRLLVWSEITNPKTRKSYWALMNFVRDTSSVAGWNLTFRTFPPNPHYPHSPVKVFSYQPRNTDIYQFLDSLKTNGQRSDFDFRYNVQDCNNSAGCSCGVFIDGDVRESTWSEVMGEKPTKFFPNGM
jgi:hypothetical protein